MGSIGRSLVAHIQSMTSIMSQKYTKYDAGDGCEIQHYGGGTFFWHQYHVHEDDPEKLSKSFRIMVYENIPSMPGVVMGGISQNVIHPIPTWIFV